MSVFMPGRKIYITYAEICKNFILFLRCFRPPSLLTLHLMAIFMLPAHLISAPLILQRNMNGIYLAPLSEFLEDKDAAYTVEEIDRGLYNQNFISVNKDIPGFGFTKSVWWIRFEVINEDQRAMDWKLELAYPMLDEITLYKKVNGRFEKVVLGDHMPFHDRLISYRNFIFPMQELPGSAQTYYLRVATSSSMNLPILAWSDRPFIEKVDNEKMLLGAYTGIMVGMSLYNLFVFLSVRDRSYLYYDLFVIGSLLAVLMLNGLAFQYLWPDWIWWANNGLPFLIGFLVLWGLMFGRKYLGVADSMPVLLKIFNALIMVAIASSILSLFADYYLSIRIMALLTIVSAIALITAGFIQTLRRFRPAYYYISSWMILLLGAIFFVLKTFGIMPTNFLTNWSLQIGSALEVVLLSFGLADRINILQQEKEKAQLQLLESRQRMMESFSRFVPREFLTYLERSDILDVNPGDATKKRLVVLFSDIRNFTRLSEQMDPEETFRFLNNYFDRISQAIYHHGGFIDKYIGDAIMALYAGDTDLAMKSAIEMRRILREYNRDRAAQNLRPIEMGIGLHTGEMMLGTVGSHKRIDTTVIGDTVNVASRLESLTKVFRIPILASGDVCSHLKNPEQFSFREIDLVRLRGRRSAIQIFEIFDGDPDDFRNRKLELLPVYKHGLELYRAGNFLEASDIFKRLHDDDAEDFLYEIYLRRCRELLREPPGPNWQGISRMR
jgi:adenylate cyclase